MVKKMEENNKPKKVFRSVIEFEKNFFPKAYKEKKKKELVIKGTGLAIEFIEDIKQKLSEK